MRDVELLADLIEKLVRDVRAEVAELSAEELSWQPDPEANNIGVTVWHFSRWLDMLAMQALANRPAAEELWQTRGWAAQTGYDPRGIGYRGLGLLTGYTQAEVAAVPRVSAGQLLEYLEQVSGALRERLLGMPSEALYQATPGLGGKRTAYDLLTSVLMGCFGHVGEIEAIKALREARCGQEPGVRSRWLLTPDSWLPIGGFSHGYTALPGASGSDDPRRLARASRS